MNKEQQIINDAQWTIINIKDQGTIKNEQLSMINEQWMMNNEQGSMINKQ